MDRFAEIRAAARFGASDAELLANWSFGWLLSSLLEVFGVAVTFSGPVRAKPASPARSKQCRGSDVFVSEPLWYGLR
jgi:hypothetical protein